MRAKRFSEAEDQLIRRMRAAGQTWDAVVAAIGHSCKVIVRDHAYRSDLVPRCPRREGAGAVTHAATQQYAPAINTGYDIMPAFHPVSWGAIWAGLETRP